MKLIYLFHGLESSPASEKIQRMKRIAETKGFAAETPDYSKITDPDQRVSEFLNLQLPTVETLVLVGSSMGAYVAAVASATVKPKALFLLAPAFYIPRYGTQNPIPHTDVVEIIHAWQDDVVPVENSIRFAREHKTRLHLVNSDHRLSDQIDLIAVLFERLLDEIEIIEGKN
jgi:alpha/beta superfamily hydrolase